MRTVLKFLFSRYMNAKQDEHVSGRRAFLSAGAAGAALTAMSLSPAGRALAAVTENAARQTGTVTGTETAQIIIGPDPFDDPYYDGPYRHRRYRRERRYLSRRELRRMCRNDRRFRRRNRALCDDVLYDRFRGRGRNCIQIGPLIICD